MPYSAKKTKCIAFNTTESSTTAASGITGEYTPADELNTYIVKCGNTKSFYPSFVPLVFTISSNKNSPQITVTGANFVYGSITANFGPWTRIPVTYLSSTQVSFTIPNEAISGTTYPVSVTNLYSGNFSPPVPYTYPPVSHTSSPPIYCKIYTI
jgi:hypothetical protein